MLQIVALRCCRIPDRLVRASWQHWDHYSRALIRDLVRYTLRNHVDVEGQHSVLHKIWLV